MSAPERTVVTVNCGKIEGVLKTSPFSGKSYYSFFGIPYAESPMIFKPSKRKENWSGTLDCSREKGKCIQYCLLNQKVEGQLDCLHVNVHIPELPNKDTAPKPVMVLVHPGGHLFGSGLPEDFGSPNVFMHRDIIYVTFNYRLDIFGFLNLNIPDCSGNMGLKDIVMAFRWVKDNIHHFNGDPENITALGPSSGASIIQLLLCIPSTEGLFHKGILMGDTLFNNFVEYRDDNVELALKFGKVLGFEGTDRQELFDYLQDQNPQNIMKAMRTMSVSFRLNSAKLFPAGVFMPSVEKEGKDRLLSVPPRKLIKFMRTIPIINGFCEKEAMFGFTESKRLSTFLTFKKTAFFQNEWGWMKQVKKHKEEMVEKILQFYFRNEKRFDEDISLCAEMCTDEMIFDSYDTLVDVIHRKSSSSTYIYRFEHIGALNTQKHKVTPLLAQPLHGTFHLDDFYHLCNNSITPEPNSVDYKVVDMMTKWFTNFAKTGNPNEPLNVGVYWEPSTPESPHHLRIKEDPELCQGNLISEERMKFWRSLKNEFFPEENNVVE